MQQYLPLAVLKPTDISVVFAFIFQLQQYLPLAVCDEGCEVAEEQNDDEACTSLVPDCKKGKTKVMM